MNKKLFGEAIAKFLLGVVLVGALIFVPAGTLRYPGGWLLMGVLFVPMFAAGLVMMAKNPQLLRSRLQAREKRGEQSLVIKCSALMFLCTFVAAGLDFRFGWLPLPEWAPIAAAVVFLICYALYAEVLRENVWLSRTVEVQENQQVVSTGLYGVVRHPMYAVTLWLFAAMPLVLGSVIGLIFLLPYPVLIARRIRDEEQLLRAELPGYDEYCRKVRWRMIPWVW